MQAGIAYIRKELKDHYPPKEIEGLIRFLFAGWKQYNVTDLLMKREEKLTGFERRYLQSVIDRLKKYEPIQYILGETEFYGLPFQVTPDVLIPRPETEELIDWILKSVNIPDPVIIDMGTGSGCIAVCLKKYLPLSSVTGCDISRAALDVARKNARQNQAEISLLQLDMTQPPPAGLLPVADLIVSNPPYITDQEKTRMHKNVTEFEPHGALFIPDDDPLKFYKALINFADKQLRNGGKQFWEINEAYEKECTGLLKEHSYIKIESRKDINGKDRMLSAEKSFQQ